MLLVVSLGFLFYQAGIQNITGYSVFEMNNNLEITAVIFTIFSILMSFGALAVSINMPSQERIKQMMSNVSVALTNNETAAARMMYIKLRNHYNRLPKDDKKKHRAECVQLYKKLVNQLMAR